MITQDDLLMALGELRTIKKDPNFSQAQFAIEAGFNPAQFNKYFKGHHSMRGATEFKLRAYLDKNKIEV